MKEIYKEDVAEAVGILVHQDAHNLLWVEMMMMMMIDRVAGVGHTMDTDIGGEFMSEYPLKSTMTVCCSTPLQRAGSESKESLSASQQLHRSINITDK